MEKGAMRPSAVLDAASQLGVGESWDEERVSS
jgi:hypothetical protein